METHTATEQNNCSQFENPIFLESLFPQARYFSAEFDLNQTERLLMFLEHAHPELLEEQTFNPEIDTIHSLVGFLKDILPEYYTCEEDAKLFTYNLIEIDDFYPIYLDDIKYIKKAPLKIGFAYMIKHINSVLKELNWEKGIPDGYFDCWFEMDFDDDYLSKSEISELKREIKKSTKEIRSVFNKVKNNLSKDFNTFLKYNPRKEDEKKLKQAILDILSVDVDAALSFGCSYESSMPYQECFKIQYVEGNMIQERINENIDTYAQEGIANPLGYYKVTDRVISYEYENELKELIDLMEGISYFRSIIRKMYNEWNKSNQ